MVGEHEGKVIIITGAGSVEDDIVNGKATAIIFALKYSKVMLVDSDFNALNKPLKSSSKKG